MRQQGGAEVFDRGEVQGVGYRFFAQRAAARHQVLGYVRNCPDGTVEALAEGSAGDVEEFKKDLVTGPQWSRVEQVEEINLEPTGTVFVVSELSDNLNLCSSFELCTWCFEATRIF